jgi:hypothetical protein
MRHLGDKYVKQEFRLHKSAKPDQLVEFFKGWEHYLDTMKARRGNVGKNIDPSLAENLTDEQREKLHQLKMSVRENDEKND